MTYINISIPVPKFPDSQEVPSREGLLRPTLLITLFSILGMIVSLLTQVILAAKFGARMEMDCYLAASVVPQFIAAVLLTALNVIFIPIFIEYELKKTKHDAWTVASITANLLFAVLVIISFLGFAFAYDLVSITAPGFKAESLSLTTGLLRIILPSTIFSGLNSLLSSIYYAHRQFFKPAIAPVMNSLVILFSVLALEPFYGIKSIALGTLFGSIISFFVLTPILFKRGRYTLSFDFHNEGIRQVIRVMLPLVFAGLFYQATTLLERMFASTLPEGSISYLGYSNRVISMLGTIATSGISVAVFPLMSRAWAENDLVKVREYFAKSFRIIMLITFPIAAIFAVLRIPIIQVFLERGKFDHHTTTAVANLLLILLVAFIASGLGNVVGRGFYISQRTKLRAILGVTQTLVYLCIASFLSKYFSFIGLAIATSIHFSLGLTVSLFVMKRIYKGINGNQIFDGFIKISVASFSSAICMYYSFSLLLLENCLILRTGVAVALGIIIYTAVAIYIFKIDEAVNLKENFIRKAQQCKIAIKETSLGWLKTRM